MAADKQIALSIVLRAVDRATAVVRKVSESIKRLPSASLKFMSEGIKGLFGEDGGLANIGEKLRGFGGALHGVFSSIKDNILGAGIGIGVLVHQLFAMVGHFDDIGDKADKLGVTADFLTSMRFAAQKSGSDVEALDQGLTTFTENMGQARAGTGRMVKFLNTVSPSLLTALKATKSNEAAFRLLADAMEKLPDRTRQLALAQKTVGNSDLAPLLARGSKGLLAMQGAFIGLAGSQEDAVDGASKVDDSMKDLEAAAHGIKAALITGLSPALQQIVDEMSAWFAENRERIAEWALAFGKRLPDIIHKFADTVLSTVDKITAFVDSIGGLKTVALAVAAVILVPLIQSVVALGVALYANPIVLILAAIAAAALLIIKYWDPIKAFFIGLWDAIYAKFGKTIEAIKKLVMQFSTIGVITKHWDEIKDYFSAWWDVVSFIFEAGWAQVEVVVNAITTALEFVNEHLDKFAVLGGPLAMFAVGAFSDDKLSGAANASPAAAQQPNARMTVDFKNAPKGMHVQTDPDSSIEVDHSVGYQLGFIGV